MYTCDMYICIRHFGSSFPCGPRSCPYPSEFCFTGSCLTGCGLPETQLEIWFGVNHFSKPCQVSFFYLLLCAGFYIALLVHRSLISAYRWTPGATRYLGGLTCMIRWCVFLWFHLLCGQDSFRVEAKERTQATCPGEVSVVVSQTEPPQALQANVAKLAQSVSSASFKGSTVVEEHQSCNGECYHCRAGALEMLLHKAQQKDGGILWPVWETLVEGDCPRRSVESMESMGRMGGSPKDSQTRIVYGKECLKTPEEQREGKRQGRFQKRKRHGIRIYVHLAVTLLRLPIYSGFDYTMGWGCNTIGDVAISGVAISAGDASGHEQRVGCCSQPSLWLPRPDACRGARTGGQSCPTNLKEYNQRVALGDVQSRTCKESIGGDCGVSTTTSTSLDSAPTRCNRIVEQAIAAVHGAPGDVVRTRRPGDAGNTSSDPCDSGAEQQGSGGTGESIHANHAGDHGEHSGRAQERPRSRRAQSAAPQGADRLCEGSRLGSQRQSRAKGRNCHSRFRQRRSTDWQTTTVYRRTQVIVINGRIGSCLKLNGQCKGHKRVSFDVVEAYDDDHRAAGHVLAYLPFPTFDFEGRQDHRIVPQKCSTGLEVDPILQLRPNANIVLHFDDMPVETSSEGEQEVPNRYVPHPNWRDSIELARAHRDRALYSGTDGRLHIKITSWFVNHDRQNEYCESRPMTIRPQLFPLLHQRLRRTWADKIRRRDSTSHIIVTPTPGALEDEERTLHVILEKNRLPDTEWQSVLFTLRAIEGGRPQQADRRAVLVHQDVTREALGRGLGIDIDPVHIMVPSGRGQGWLQAQEVRVVTRGQHIPIWWDSRRRIETTPVDATALFQLGVTRDLAWKTRLAESSDRSTSMYDEVEEEYYQEGGTAEREVPRIEADEEYTDECTLAGSMEDLHDATLHTYGLFGWHLGIRSSPIHRIEGWNLRDEVQRLWPEIHALRNIINVPALTIPQREIHVIVEFFEGRLARHGELPCLRRTFNYRWNHPAIEAVYLPPGGTRTDILYHGGYDDVCQPWKEHKCSVRIDNTILVADDQAQLQNGALIDIWIYDVEEDDPTSLMQRSVATTPEPEGEEQTWSTLHMPEESLPITLSIGGELSALEKINREWRDDGRLHGYTAIHDVSEPPEDLEAVTSKTVILEHPFDLASRIDRTDILALVDIELINPNIAMDRFTLRQVFWLRRAMSFNTVLHFLLAYELCERDMDTRCILQHNKQHWDRRDESFYVMANGDYIKLQIIGKDGTGWVDLLEVLRRVERSYQRRSIYGTSASTIATDSFAEAEELPGSQPDEEPEECGMMQIGKPQQLTHSCAEDPCL